MSLGSETIEELLSRKSVRVFTGEHIPQEQKELILEAAVNAPSAGCQQLYTIIDVTDQEIKKKLVITCDHQPFIAEADLVLIFCADCRKWYEGFVDTGCDPRLPGEGDLLLAVTDAAIAAQNAVTAAWSLGIGSCYIGDIMENCEEQRALLGLPSYVLPAVMIVFGYPTAQQMERRKPNRASMRTIVYENRYPEQTAKDREEMFFRSRGLSGYMADKADTADTAAQEKPDGSMDPCYMRWMQAFCDRKYNSDFSREMTRSIREYLKDYSRNPEKR